MAAPCSEGPCALCGAAAPYTCPRCQRRVCSVRCYRGHGTCAEAFYREQVLQALEAERGTPPGRDRVASALRRLQRLREAEDSSEPGEDELWERLSPAEQEGFVRLLRSGEAAALLPRWRPWWWRRGGDGDPDPHPQPPGPAPAVPAFPSLPAPPPSPLLPFQLPNVLYGYAFALSLHNGDESLLPELPAAAVAVSAALRSRCPFSSTAEALEAARRDAEAAGLPLCPLGRAGPALAVAELLEAAAAGPALGHLERLLRAGGRCSGPRLRERFGRARRKCRFLRAWTAEAAAGPAMAAMARDARGVHAALEAAGPGRGPLIEEVD